MRRTATCPFASTAPVRETTIQMTTGRMDREDEEVAMVAGAATESPHHEPSLAEVVAQMQERLDTLPPRLQQQRVFLSTYQRTTIAVGTALAGGRFEDPAWV